MIGKRFESKDVWCTYYFDIKVPDNGAVDAALSRSSSSLLLEGGKSEHF